MFSSLDNKMAHLVPLRFSWLIVPWGLGDARQLHRIFSMSALKNLLNNEIDLATSDIHGKA